MRRRRKNENAIRQSSHLQYERRSSYGEILRCLGDGGPTNPVIDGGHPRESEEHGHDLKALLQTIEQEDNSASAKVLDTRVSLAAQKGAIYARR
jgi:hypothetical protein